MKPPVEPELEDCCRSGCCPCVFDLYEQALERYEAWLKEHPDQQSVPPTGQVKDRRPHSGGARISSEQPKD